MEAPETTPQSEASTVEPVAPAKPKLTAPQVVRQAKEQLSMMTGLEPDTVSSFGKDGEGWHVTIEMVEMKRIPNSSDVLATYDILLDEEGNLASYNRTQRYYRSQVAD